MYVNGLIKNVLVICPLSIVNTWQEQLEMSSSFGIWDIIVGNKNKRLESLEKTFNFSKRYLNWCIINIDGISVIKEELAKKKFDMVIIDECFISGTKIKTINGNKKIEDIRVGDLVYNAAGIGKVKNIIKRETFDLIKLKLSNNKEIICTPKHLFFTENGWLPAKEIINKEIFNINKIEEILNETINKKLSNMQSFFYFSSLFINKRKKILQQILFSEMENGTIRNQEKSLYERKKRKNKQSTEGEEIRHSFMEQGNINERGIKEKTQQNFKINWTQTNIKGRKWKNCFLAEKIKRWIRKWLDNGVCSKNKQRWIDKISSLSLQNRHCEFSNNDSNRSGWFKSFFLKIKNKRQEKRRKIEIIRVESIEIYKSSSQMEYSGNNKNNKNNKTIVYNLEIDGHPSYYVEGILVHNCTIIKNKSAQRTKLVTELFSDAAYKIIMSGNIIPKSVDEIFTQYRFADCGIYGTYYYSFINKYCEVDYFNKVTALKNGQEFHSKMHSIAFRKTKKECLDLPPKIYEKELIEMIPDQKQVYKEMEKDAIASYKDKTCAATVVITKFLRLSQIAGGFFPDNEGGGEYIIPNKKLERLVEIILELPVTEQIVIWARFQKEIEIIDKALKEKNISCVTFYGKTSFKDKNIAKELFREKKVRAFIGNPSSGGKGINDLIGATTVIYYSNDYSAENRIQSEDRNHRNGTIKVLYIDLIMKDTIDEIVLTTIRQNIDFANALLNKMLIL